MEIFTYPQTMGQIPSFIHRSSALGHLWSVFQLHHSTFIAVGIYVNSIAIFVNNGGIWSQNQTITLTGDSFSQTCQLTDDHQQLAWLDDISGVYKSFVTPFDSTNNQFNVANTI